MPWKSAQQRKAYYEKYNKSESARAARDKYKKTDKGKATRAKYHASEKGRAAQAKYRYGEAIAPQRGACEICRLETRMVIDHDHSTGQIRGLICSSCNKALGLFKDNPEALRNAAAYIEHPPYNG